MLFRTCGRFACPLVVMVIFAGLVVVTAGVLMVALPHAVGYIAKAVLSIDIAYKALLFSTVWTGELTGLMTRQFFTL